MIAMEWLLVISVACLNVYCNYNMMSSAAENITCVYGLFGAFIATWLQGYKFWICYRIMIDMECVSYY